MKTPQSLILIICITFSALFVEISQAQETQGSQETDEKVIRALEDQERLAVLNRDLESLKRIWSKHFMVNAPGNIISQNRDIPLGLVQTGLIHYTSFERSIEGLRIDGDIAFVMGVEMIIPTGMAPRAGQTVKRRFTHVWKRDGETWHLVARHAIILPPE